ncbi:MAG: hypothetical protein V1909_05725 [Candidatus Micrarchaeota archaeon]
MNSTAISSKPVTRIVPNAPNESLSSSKLFKPESQRFFRLSRLQAEGILDNGRFRDPGCDSGGKESMTSRLERVTKDVSNMDYFKKRCEGLNELSDMASFASPTRDLLEKISQLLATQITVETDLQLKPRMTALKFYCDWMLLENRDISAISLPELPGADHYLSKGDLFAHGDEFTPLLDRQVAMINLLRKTAIGLSEGDRQNLVRIVKETDGGLRSQAISALAFTSPEIEPLANSINTLCDLREQMERKQPLL